MGKIKWTDGTDKYVAFVGGGYDTDDNNQYGKAFFMIDLATGDKLAEYYNDEVTIDDRQYMNFSIAANPTAIDEDGDGYVDLVYVGDVGGQLWKFEPITTQTTTIPDMYWYSYLDDNGVYFEKIFTIEFDIGVTQVELKFADESSQPLAWPTPVDCLPDCYIYKRDGTDPYSAISASNLGFIGIDAAAYGSGTTLYGVNLEFIETVDGVIAGMTYGIVLPQIYAELELIR